MRVFSRVPAKVKPRESLARRSGASTVAARRSSARTRKGNAVRGQPQIRDCARNCKRRVLPPFRHCPPGWEGGGAAFEPRARRPAAARRSFAGRDQPNEPDASVAATRAVPRLAPRLSLNGALVGTKGAPGTGTSLMRHYVKTALIAALLPLATPALAQEAD